MALTHIDHHAETFTSLNGDHTVKEYLDSAVAIFPGLKSLEVRCESTGPIAIAIGKTMTALTDGKQLTQGDSAEERSVRFEQVDAGNVHIFASGTSDKIFIDAHSSL